MLHWEMAARLQGQPVLALNSCVSSLVYQVIARKQLPQVWSYQMKLCRAYKIEGWFGVFE